MIIEDKIYIEENYISFQSLQVWGFSLFILREQELDCFWGQSLLRCDQVQALLLGYLRYASRDEILLMLSLFCRWDYTVRRVKWLHCSHTFQAGLYF